MNIDVKLRTGDAASRQGSDQSINCADGCKSSVPSMDAAATAVWTYLPITGRWRCLACTRALNLVNLLEKSNE